MIDPIGSAEADLVTHVDLQASPVRLSWLPVLAAVIVIFFYIALVLKADTQRMVVAAIAAGLVAVWAGRRLGWIDLVGVSFRKHDNLAAALCGLSVWVLAVVFHNDSFVLLLLVAILLNMTACFGLNIQFGYAGMLNFAGAAMLGVGAYTTALLSAFDWIPSLMLLPLGGAAAALIGSLLLPPMLRTQGHYSAVITVAFSLLFTTFLDSFQGVGGSQGLSVRSMTMFGWDFANGIQIGSFKFAFYANYLVLALVMAMIVAVFVRRIERSWIGLSLDAVRIDETASGCFGINIYSTKIFAFSVGNFIVGMVGALYAFVLGYIAPSNFGFGDSLILITIMLLGGLGSLWGVAITTAIVLILPERLQAIQEYRLLVYAILVLLVLRFVPNGLFPRAARRYF